MASDNNNDTSNRGLGSSNMDEKTKHEIQSKGGKASAQSSQGTAGKTEAARRGGEHSHQNS
jgi:general stress protein YciG